MIRSNSKKSRVAFTLIELLVAVAIITILTAFLVPQVSVLRRKSYIQNTKAFIQSVKTALSLYHNEFRDYPPDSFDVNGDQGYNYQNGTIRLGNNWQGGNRFFKNTGCLVYFLCMPMTKITIVGSTIPGETSIRDQRSTKVGPFLTDFKSSNFSVPNFTVNLLKTSPLSDAVNEVEFVDAWGRPFEYDKLTNPATHFQRQRFDAAPFTTAGSHWPNNASITGVEEGDESDCGVVEELNRVFDPRRAQDGTSGCINQGSPISPKNSGGYDFWSHGELWTDPVDDLGSWTD